MGYDSVQSFYAKDADLPAACNDSYQFISGQTVFLDEPRHGAAGAQLLPPQSVVSFAERNGPTRRAEFLCFEFFVTNGRDYVWDLESH
jgi:hypothetical protein